MGESLNKLEITSLSLFGCVVIVMCVCLLGIDFIKSSFFIFKSFFHKVLKDGIIAI